MTGQPQTAEPSASPGCASDDSDRVAFVQGLSRRLLRELLDRDAHLAIDATHDAGSVTVAVLDALGVAPGASSSAALWLDGDHAPSALEPGSAARWARERGGPTGEVSPEDELAAACLRAHLDGSDLDSAGARDVAAVCKARAARARATEARWLAGLLRRRQPPEGQPGWKVWDDARRDAHSILGAGDQDGVPRALDERARLLFVELLDMRPGCAAPALAVALCDQWQRDRTSRDGAAWRAASIGRVIARGLAAAGLPYGTLRDPDMVGLPSATDVVWAARDGRRDLLDAIADLP